MSISFLTQIYARAMERDDHPSLPSPRESDAWRRTVFQKVTNILQSQTDWRDRNFCNNHDVNYVLPIRMTTETHKEIGWEVYATMQKVLSLTRNELASIANH